MDCSSCSGTQGALAMQAGMAEKIMNSAPPAPQTASVDSAARTAGLQAEGIGQKLNIVA